MFAFIYNYYHLKHLNIEIVQNFPFVSNSSREQLYCNSCALVIQMDNFAPQVTFTCSLPHIHLSKKFKKNLTYCNVICDPVDDISMLLMIRLPMIFLLRPVNVI